jgi:hypothetical protein
LKGKDMTNVVDFKKTVSKEPELQADFSVNFNRYLNFMYGYGVPKCYDNLDYTEFMMELNSPLIPLQDRYALNKWMTQHLPSGMCIDIIKGNPRDLNYDKAVTKKNHKEAMEQGTEIPCPDPVVEFLNSGSCLPNTKEELKENFKGWIDQIKRQGVIEGVNPKFQSEHIAELIYRFYSFGDCLYIRLNSSEGYHDISFMAFLLDMIEGRPLERCGELWGGSEFGESWSDETEDNKSAGRKKWLFSEMNQQPKGEDYIYITVQEYVNRIHQKNRRN